MSQMVAHTGKTNFTLQTLNKFAYILDKFNLVAWFLFELDHHRNLE